jgi:hypothetical protein
MENCGKKSAKMGLKVFDIKILIFAKVATKPNFGSVIWFGSENFWLLLWFGFWFGFKKFFIN